MRDRHQVPGFFQRVRFFDSNMKDVDGPAGLAGQHHRSGFGDIAWTARAIDGKRRVHAFCHAPRHHRKSAQASAGGTALGGAEAEVLDHAPRPLAVEVSRVHHHHAPIAPVPGGGNNAAMPEGGNHRHAPGARFPVVMHAQLFETQRGAKNANDGDHRRGDDRDLHPPPARELGQAGIVERTDRLGGGWRARALTRHHAYCSRAAAQRTEALMEVGRDARPPSLFVI